MANRCHNSLLRSPENGYEPPTYPSATLSPTNLEFPNKLPATIDSSIFRANSTLNNLILHNCVLNTAVIRDCTVRNGVLHHCILFDCNIKNTVVKHCQVINRPLALRRFPAELRMKIFEYVVEDEAKDGSIPALVKALRGDQMLYREVISVLYRKGLVPLSFVVSMERADIGLITKVSVDTE